MLFLQDKTLTFSKAVKMAMTNKFAREARNVEIRCSAAKSVTNIEIKKELEKILYLKRKGRHQHQNSRQRRENQQQQRHQVKCSVCGKMNHSSEQYKYLEYCNLCGKTIIKCLR